MTIIIAEAGVNHNGDINIAKKLVLAAKESGADYVKFQTFKAWDLVTQNAQKANYQITNTKSNESQYEMLKRLEIDTVFHQELFCYCKDLNIGFLSSAFSEDDLFALSKFKMDYIKIPSGEITNFRYLKFACQYNSKIILSTGMSTLKEVSNAFELLLDSGINKKNIWILQCTTEYPASFNNVNLNVLKTYKDTFNTNYGYSDHTLGIEVPIAAVALGCRMIEKHLTLDRNLPGPDHAASIEPEKFKEMVIAIRNIEKSMGSYEKNPSDPEKENMLLVRKSLVANKDIPIGTIFNKENLICKRPGNGICASKYENYLGKVSLYGYKKGELIN